MILEMFKCFLCGELIPYDQSAEYDGEICCQACVDEEENPA